MKRTHLALFFILLFALILRIIPSIYHNFNPNYIFTPDSPIYVDLGESLCTGKGFKRTTTSSVLENPWEYEIFRTPGYPTLLCLLSKLTTEPLRLAIHTQIALDLLIILLTYLITGGIFGKKTGILAAFLMAVNVPHIVQSNMIMSDVLFSLFIALSVWCMVKLRKPSLGAISWLLAITIRPVASLGHIALLPLINRIRGFNLASIGVVIAFIVAVFSYPGYLMVRNYHLTGKASLSNTLDFNLYLVIAPKLKALGEGIPRHEAGALITNELYQNYDEANPSSWYASLREAGAPYYKKYWHLLPEVLGKSLFEMMFAGERRHLLRVFTHPGGGEKPSLSEGKATAGGIINRLLSMDLIELFIIFGQLAYNILLWTFTLAGLYRLYLVKKYRYLIFSVLFLGYFLAGSMVVATARMRMPISFLLAALAAGGVTSLIQTKCLTRLFDRLMMSVGMR